jgi:hypothetical protein
MKSALLAELLEPLRENRGEAGGEILRHKLVSLRNQVVHYLQVALAAATQAELQGKITAELRAQFPLWKLRLPPLLNAWREWLNDWLQRELTALSRSEQAMFCAPLHRTQAHLTRALLAFQDRLAGHVKSALGITLAPREFALEVHEPTAPPVDVSYAFDAAFTTVGWLIPLTPFRRPIERVLLRKARYEVEKNLSRLAADWRDRVGVAIEDLRRQTESAALSELEALERMLEQAPSSVPHLREGIAALELSE